MKLGKIPENVLKRSVLRQLKTKNSEVKHGAGMGEDCAVFAFSGREDLVTCMQEGAVSVNPTEPGELTMGTLIQKCANNLACGGAGLTAVLISLILPESAEESEIKEIMAAAERQCALLSAEIAGGQTKISSAVIRPVAVVTGYGKAFCSETVEKKAGEEKDPWYSGKAVPGEDIVVSKWIGLEGTAILAKRNKEKLLARYPAYFIEEAAGFDRYLSMVPEAAAAVKSGVNAMHDASEGGIFGALRELAEKAGVGLTIDLKKLPLRQETVEVCECCQVNPYELASGGCLIMTAKDGQSLVKALEAEGIPAAVVGRTTDSNDRIILNEDEIRFLDRAGQDAVYVNNEEGVN